MLERNLRDTTIEWEIKPFKALSIDELYDLLKLRTDVFVVEQNCPYPEVDNKDRHSDTLHLIGRDQEGDISAYLRIIPPGLSYPQASIGRVVVEKSKRGKGICGQMVKKAIAQIAVTWPGKEIKIGAQQYLQQFYESHGFQVASDMYIEDGIPHLDMVL